MTLHSRDDGLVEALMFHQLVEVNSKLQLDNALLRRAISEKDHLLELAYEVLEAMEREASYGK